MELARLVCRQCSRGKEYIRGYTEKVRVCDLCLAKLKQERFQAKSQNKAKLHLCRIKE